MKRKCSFCELSFEESEMPEHLLVAHEEESDPEVSAERAHAVHECTFCHLDLASPEALGEHIRTKHGR